MKAAEHLVVVPSVLSGQPSIAKLLGKRHCDLQSRPVRNTGLKRVLVGLAGVLRKQYADVVSLARLHWLACVRPTASD